MTISDIETAPLDNEVIALQFTGEAIRGLLAFLNSKNLRDSRGLRIAFSLRQMGDYWTLAETLHGD